MANEEHVIVFQREAAQDCFAEAIPLLIEHWQEITYIDGLTVKPEFSKYESLERNGILRTYTARLEGKLIGYAVFFLSPHLHFKKHLFAYCDVLYIMPAHRGFGHRFTRWCNNRLRDDRASVILYNVNKKFDFGSILKRQGFKHTDDVYTMEVRF